VVHLQSACISPGASAWRNSCAPEKTVTGKAELLFTAKIGWRPANFQVARYPGAIKLCRCTHVTCANTMNRLDRATPCTQFREARPWASRKSWLALEDPALIQRTSHVREDLVEQGHELEQVSRGKSKVVIWPVNGVSKPFRLDGPGTRQMERGSLLLGVRVHQESTLLECERGSPLSSGQFARRRNPPCQIPESSRMSSVAQAKSPGVEWGHSTRTATPTPQTPAQQGRPTFSLLIPTGSATTYVLTSAT
jgi:hypothetical protein